MSKEKGAVHNTWSHHETMIINLRDWVRRDIETLRTNLAKEVPTLAEDPSILKVLKTAEDMNAQLWDLIRSVVDRAEAEAKKQKKAAKVETTSEPDEELVG